MSVWVAGRYHVDWPGVCKYHGWDPKTLCGPVIMAGNQDNAEVNCPWGHSAGKHPPGTSKQVGVTNVYPARHFGRPTGA